ncbi:outer membrane protein assembly factor BamE [Mariluticola halotolerans]|uniref:outer membrane protein assembly factor BamE n=1 Tax=Mariluticola halotolerans TaxID=2909283 RepID=UPI0026E1DE1C|nr:outer membrane protein assembly factor BamE [Mariluticola halotolerans]UJQ95648.1 outer membrane protein assembly factor BamE [Mariluticola halotolerans]
MSLRHIRGHLLPLAAAAVIGLTLSGCSGFTSSRTQGYALSESALKQIRPGQSEDLVIAVLGSPQTKGAFGDETAFYYIETKVEETAFGWQTVKQRTVLAIYFDKNRRVTDKAVYGLEDGKLITLETRRTPSFGEDRTFVESIISSF